MGGGGLSTEDGYNLRTLDASDVSGGRSSAPDPETDDPCESDDPPGFCDIGCKVQSSELETMFFNESSSDALDTFKELVHKFGGEFRIDSKRELRHFMGQMAFESGYEITSAEEAHFSEKEMLDEPEVSRTEEKRDGDETYNLERVMDSEKLQFSVYYDNTDRLGNGEPSTYDGWKFRGRGPTQLTGRYNYKQFNRYYSDFAQEQGWNAPDVLENPEKVTNSARIGTIAALRFWDQHGSGEVDSLTVENVTEAINGGDNGLTQRKNQTEKAEEEISCNN